MYIIPDSTIILCENLRINSSYQDQIYFTAAQAQQAYFQSKARYTLNDYSYIRQTGRIRVGLTMQQAYGLTYMMFKNTSFENKWFYAFITSIDYINNQCVEITFVLDLIQTYLFDYELRSCFIDRQHTADDTIGANIIPEGLETGAFLYDERSDGGDVSRLLWNGQWEIVIWTTLNSTGSAQGAITGRMLGGLYSGLNYYRFTTAEAANTYLTNVAECGAESGIVAITMLPTALLDMNESTITVQVPRRANIGGYVPRNNKLFTKEFYGLYVTNSQGALGTYAFEDFTDPATPTFTLYFSLGAVSDCLLMPNGYREDGKQYGIGLTSFPQCAFAIDAYKSWLARNAPIISIKESEIEAQRQYNTATSSNERRTINSAAQTESKMTDLKTLQTEFGGNPVKWMMNLASIGIQKAAGINYLETVGVGNELGQLRLQHLDAQENYKSQLIQNTHDAAYQNKILSLQIDALNAQKEIAAMTPNTYGGSSAGSAMKLSGNFGYRIGEYKARRQFLEQADDFFDLYGYKVARIATPQRAVRKHWTYVRTVGATFFNMNVPDDDLKAIKALYDGGIRWWRDGDEIGEAETLKADNTILT